MFFPEGQIRVHLYGQPVDLRRSFDGLHALARQGLHQDPLQGQLFVFLNRRATQVKILYWDRTGFCIWAKRLEEGRFVSDWSRMRTQELDWTALKLLLEGIVPARRKHRYSVPAEHCFRQINSRLRYNDACLPSPSAESQSAPCQDRR